MRYWNTLIVAACMATLTAGVCPAQTGQAGQAPGGMGVPALTPDAIDQLVAPVALYPDALVIQIVQCASSPYQVKQVSDWLKQNPDLKGSVAQDAAAEQGFDASFVAIVLFPQVVQMMAEKPDWTRELGQAFTTDRDGVLESVQRLRQQAQAVGNLKTTGQQTVQSVPTDGGQQVIVIQPANPQVVYVPQYNPQVVYTQPPPTTSSSTDDDDDDGKVIAAALIGFAAGVIVGAEADDDDDHYYYASGGWGYARPICYPSGYNNYYQHRENMANDYYRHRENMANDYYQHREDIAGQRGENQGNRQDYRSGTIDDRQANTSDNMSQRQGAASQNQASRQESMSQTRSTNQSTRQATAGQWQSSAQTRASTTSRGSLQANSQQSWRTTGTQSGAFSGYQRGSTERQSAARGHSSMSQSGSRSGGGRSGGGGRR